jgi:hypothetical protein
LALLLQVLFSLQRHLYRNWGAWKLGGIITQAFLAKARFGEKRVSEDQSH